MTCLPSLPPTFLGLDQRSLLAYTPGVDYGTRYSSPKNWCSIKLAPKNLRSGYRRMLKYIVKGRNKVKFQQLTEFEWERIIGLREVRFSYRVIGARVQRNRSTVMRVLKQWTDEPRNTRKNGSGRRKGTSVRYDQHRLRMAVNDYTASTRQLTARLLTATGVLLSASSIRRHLLHCRLHARVLLYRIPLKANH
ncbi:transposable element Tc1 transposase [Trichonephila clavipes]|nr:transposable element Tc1 transposase [Trichonephila clavipes]